MLAVYYAFGLPAMYGVVFILFVLCVRLQRRRPLSFDNADWLGLGVNQPPSLPPPSKPALSPPGPPQIGQAQRIKIRTKTTSRPDVFQ